MTATAAMIAQIRRLTNEPDATTYSDEALRVYIEAYPLLDERGQEAYYYNALAVPPVAVANTSWIATYDLYAAAADIWDEKAAGVADQFDFAADGGNYSVSQKYAMYVRQAKHCRSRRSIKTISLTPAVKTIDEAPDTWRL